MSSIQSEPSKPDEGYAFVVEQQGGIALHVGLTGLPITKEQAASQYFTITEVMKKLEARAELLKKHIINQMVGDQKVVGEVKASGIRYLGYARKSTKWTEATNEIIEELVPKTKAAEAHGVIDKFTTQTVVQKIERDE